MHIGCCHIIGMNYSADTAQGMKLVAVIVHVLRGAVTPGWRMPYVVLTHLTPVSTGILTDLYRLRVYAEDVFASIIQPTGLEFLSLSSPDWLNLLDDVSLRSQFATLKIVTLLKLC